jgi:hypothetical protein
MSRITDINYTLPIIEALTPHDVLESGANRPLLITGANSQGVKGDYVVKFRNAQRMSAEACMRELISLFIARELEIQSVSPVIIHISAEFVELLQGKSIWQIASQSIGHNFGSEYIKGEKTLLVPEELNSYQLPFAQSIFIFDVFIQNPDRTVNKPNMLTDARDITIFDHELAFGFIFDLFKNPTPWIISNADMIWINQHVLLPRIRGKEFDFEGFMERLLRLDANFWDKAWNLLPPQWRVNQFEQIREYLSSIVAHADSFMIELKKLMS